MTPPPGPNFAFRAELAEILDVSLADLPAAFRYNKPRAIEIGEVFQQIKIRYPLVNHARVADFLERFTESPRYLRKVIHSRHLHDLDGNTVREIPERTRKAARAKLHATPKKFATDRCVESPSGDEKGSQPNRCVESGSENAQTSMV
jgi:sRNA-binding protein